MVSDSIRARLRDRGELVPTTPQAVALAEALMVAEVSGERVVGYISGSADSQALPLIPFPSTPSRFAFAARRGECSDPSKAGDPTAPDADLDDAGTD